MAASAARMWERRLRAIKRLAEHLQRTRPSSSVRPPAPEDDDETEP